MIFETSDYTVGWDGTYQEKEQPIGSYVFMLRYLEGDQEAIIQGSVTLIR